MSYVEHHQTLVRYLLGKVNISDWHSVADAAMDLRELEAKKRAIDEYAQRVKHAKN